MVVGSNPTRITMSEGTLYILQSKETGKFYTGSTSDLERRLRDHKRGNTKTTRIHKPWFLVYKETFETLFRGKKS